jgi:hypothetical protein
MSEWLTSNLERYKEITTERREISRQEAELKERRENLDRLESGLKTLLEIAIETEGNDRAKARYERICRVVSAGENPSAKVNKTHLILSLLKDAGQPGLTVTDVEQGLSALGIEVTRGYLHTVLNKLRTERGLVTREGDSFVLTEKGMGIPLKIQPS